MAGVDDNVDQLKKSEHCFLIGGLNYIFFLIKLVAAAAESCRNVNILWMSTVHQVSMENTFIDFKVENITLL